MTARKWGRRHLDAETESWRSGEDLDGASRTPPAIGTRVLLLLDADPPTTPGGVVVPLDNDLFLERPGGGLSAPRKFPAEGLSFDALLRGLGDAR